MSEAIEPVKRKRGRPRKYDEQQVLMGALDVFWRKGFSATSLDDLADAMSMNRPSIYNAFGNKDAIYRKTLAMICGQMEAGLQSLLASAEVKSGFIAFYDQALALYCADEPQRGCPVICTAPSEVLNHSEVKEDLVALINQLDSGFANRLERAQKEGHIDETLDVKMTAKLLQATLQTLALRARAGEPRTALKKLARYSVDSLIPI